MTEKQQNWRNEPATQRQLNVLARIGVEIPKGITKGDASDIIAQHREPDEAQLSILKFFGKSAQTSYDAGIILDEIFADEDNRKKWENRPADKSQKDFYRFFNISILKGLKHKNAQAKISEVLKEESNAKAWEEHEQKLMDIEDVISIAQDDFELYDSKKPSKKVIQQALEELKSSGLTAREISFDISRLFEKILEIKPDLRRNDSTAREARITTAPKKRIYKNSPKKKKLQGSDWGTIIGILAMLLLIWIWLTAD